MTRASIPSTRDRSSSLGILFLIVCFVLLPAAGTRAAPPATDDVAAPPATRPAVAAGRTLANLEYAKVDDVSLQLDLYLPAKSADQPNAAPPPLVVWVHGGGWTTGRRRPCPMTWLVQRGYAVASITYRLAPKYPFPAQIDDCKAAIRWLRANAAKYSYDPQRIGVCGESAGGHLVALLGLTNGNKDLEGKVGDHLDISSDVQAVCDLYGPTDMLKFSTDRIPGTVDVNSILTKLFGGPVSEKHDLAIAASPVTYVKGKDTPPFLIVQGDHDPLVPIDQSWELFYKMRAAGAPVELWVIPNGSHVIGIRYTPYFEPRLNTFFDAALKHTPARHK